MMIFGNIKPTDGAPKPVPSGKYICEMIHHTEPTAAKSGKGRWVRLTWRVTEGEHAGHLIFQTINFEHSNPLAEEIGQKELGNIAFACGHTGIDFDLVDCHGIPCLLQVSEKEDPDFGPQNVVRRVSKLSSQSAPPLSNYPPQGSPPPANGGNAPWR